MKIMLTKDVENVGHAGEIKDVADGYGRNFLIPRKLAVVAGRVIGPPSFLGKIGQKVIDASPEGGLVVVFELAN